MAVSPLDSRIWGGLYGDAEVGARFSDEAEVEAIMRFERALARAEGRLGVIPADAAAAIDAALASVAVEPESLRDGTGAAGVPVPALVAALRERCPDGAGSWLHWGATSQDAIDCALALRLGQALDVLDGRLGALVDTLAAVARRHARLPMAGRTRSQVATPITFGLRVATWAAGFAEVRDRLPAVRAGAARVQFGGGSGSASVVAPHGLAIGAALAEELGLASAPPWGTRRAGLVDCGAWLAQVAGASGKMAGDLLIMGRSEIAEARAGASGGSSTIPQKRNPVPAETVIALARFSAGLTAPLNLALAHHEERDASAWGLEWLALPQLAVAAAACLRHAGAMAGALEPVPETMAATLATAGGSVFAEAASFALSRLMPRTEAQALVKRAAAEAARHGRPLRETLAAMTDAPVDWDEVFSTAPPAEAAAAMVEALLGDGTTER